MKLQKLLATLAITWTLLATGAHAQDQPPQNGNNPPADAAQPVAPLQPQQNNTDDRQAPAPAARGLFLPGNTQDQNNLPFQPDDHLLSGAVTPGLGHAQGSQRLFDPAFQVQEAVDTGGVGQNVNSVTSIGGSLALDQRWNVYRFAAAYSGSQTFYEPDTSLSQTYQYLTVAQEAHWKRLGLLVRDDFFYSPESNFGGLYAGTLGVFGQNTTLAGINPVLQTPETILTGRVNRVNNTSLAEIDYSLTRRATLTFVGSYGFLHFSNPGFLGSRTTNASAGYNYALSSKNTIALIYNYSIDHYTIGGAIETHLAQLAFGRKITQRLSLQITGGPDLLLSHNLGPTPARRWMWSLTASVNYQRSRNTGYNFAYFRGITAGSGVFLGAVSDTFTGSVAHKFTRFWSMSINTGYSRNTNLVPLVGITSRYDNWFAGASVARQIGREIRLVGSYAFQEQYNAPGNCPVLSCGPSGSGRNVVSVSLEWHPFAIQTE